MAHNSVTCPACGVEEASPDERPLPPLHELGEFNCDACGACFVFGKPIPRIVIEPHYAQGVRFTRVRFQDPKTKTDAYVADFDPKSAVMIAKNILSISVS